MQLYHNGSNYQQEFKSFQVSVVHGRRDSQYFEDGKGLHFLLDRKIGLTYT
jgi:hypothetical protein